MDKEIVFYTLSPLKVVVTAIPDTGSALPFLRQPLILGNARHKTFTKSLVTITFKKFLLSKIVHMGHFIRNIYKILH